MFVSRKCIFHILVHAAALLPAALIVWDSTRGQLTANPIQEITLRTGKTTLVLLVLTLSCTPFRLITGIRAVLPLRRILGLYTFSYACLHFLIFVGLDYGFNLPLIFEEVLKKRFAIAGFAAFITLLPLVITSTRGWAKRLGGDWQRLHKLVYLTALLAVTHFTWQVKADFRLPLLYGIIIIFLLVIRLPQVRAKLDELTLPLRNLISAIGRHK